MAKGDFPRPSAAMQNETFHRRAKCSAYTDFAAPHKTVYSWNRSRPFSEDAFLAQDLAVHFGFASEIEALRRKNPNLDFDVAMMPQIRDFSFKSTLAHMTALSVLKTSQNPALAEAVARVLVSPEMAAFFSEESGFPPVRRDLLGKKPSNAAQSVFYDSAIISTGWLDPEPQKTGKIFQNAVEAVLSGASDVSKSVQEMAAQFTLLGKK